MFMSTRSSSGMKFFRSKLMGPSINCVPRV